MHTLLAQALNLLDISEISLFNDELKINQTISPREHAVALFTYLDLAGYLSPPILTKAIHYMAAAKPFSCATELVIQDLIKVYEIAHRDSEFNINWFFEHFCNQPYFQTTDIIDLIVFLQQTAFDREFGVERDRLQDIPWLERDSDLFQNLATQLGIVTPLPPIYENYCGTGIMGAASVRVETRLQHFNSLTVDCGELWALSGNRELSKGLDSDSIMAEVALAVDKPFNFVEKGTGLAKRSFLDGITETMMVNFLIRKMCPERKIALVDSEVQIGHWRATTAQGAKDIAKILIAKILEGEIVRDQDGTYHFMIIAEQPYTGRMTRQVQRAFDLEIQTKQLEKHIRVVVNGVGPGLSFTDLHNLEVLKRLNSELGSLISERYNDACRHLLQGDPSIVLRTPKILMFSERNAMFKELTTEKQPSTAIQTLQ